MAHGDETGEKLGAAVERFGLLTNLEAHQGSADISRDLFDGPVATYTEILDDLVKDPEVAAALQAELTAVANDEAALAFLGKQGLSSRADLDAAAALLAEKRQTPVHRLAQRYSGSLGNTQPAASTESERSETTTANPIEREAVAAFLSRDVSTVARDLESMKLKIGDDGEAVSITKTREQDAAFNAKFLKTRPIFGPERSDVYVGATHSRFMLFLAAGDPADATDCVAIMGIRMADDNEYDKPTQVARELGLSGEKVGNVRLEDGVLILDLQDRKQQD